jgi:hypothetical protein
MPHCLVVGSIWMARRALRRPERWVRANIIVIEPESQTLNDRVPPDPRLPSSRAVAAQRSINLAISSRGLAAIRAIDSDIVGRFLNSALPMRGRMIHLLGGGLHSQPYDIHGQVGPINLSASTAQAFLTC